MKLGESAPWVYSVPNHLDHCISFLEIQRQLVFNMAPCDWNEVLPLLRGRPMLTWQDSQWCCGRWSVSDGVAKWHGVLMSWPNVTQRDWPTRSMISWIIRAVRTRSARPVCANQSIQASLGHLHGLKTIWPGSFDPTPIAHSTSRNELFLKLKPNRYSESSRNTKHNAEKS